MAKKVRRARSAPTENENKADDVNNEPLTEEDEFRREYAYVLKDLRRMFILAAIMFLILIGVNLLFQYLG